MDPSGSESTSLSSKWLELSEFSKDRYFKNDPIEQLPHTQIYSKKSILCIRKGSFNLENVQIAPDV